MAEPISVRAFAKLEKCSHTLVNRAIKLGRLKADKSGKVDPDLVGSGWKRSNRMAGGVAGPASETTEPDNWKQVGEALEKAPGETFEEKAAHLAGQGNLFSTLSAAELRKQTFMALMAEHKYNVEIGSVVPVAAIGEIVGERFAAVRSRILAIPGEEAPRIHRCKTVAEVQAILLDVVTEALEEISSGEIAGDVQARA